MRGPGATPATSPTVAGEIGLTPLLSPNTEIQGLRARLGLTWWGRGVGLLASRKWLSLPQVPTRALLACLLLARLLLARALLARLLLARLLLLLLLLQLHLLLLKLLLLHLLLLRRLPVRRPVHRRLL